MSDGTNPAKAVADFEKVIDKADVSVASFDTSHESPLQKVRGFLHAYPTAVPVFVLVASILMFGVTAGERFFTANNLSLVLQQVTVIGIIAIAQTLVILTAGIDLSVGAIMVLSSIVIGKLAVQAGVPEPFAILIGGCAGAAMGYVNGTLVTRLRLPPFIVTLGTLYIFSALKIWYRNRIHRATDTEAIAPLLIFFGNTLTFAGAKITYGGISFILLAVLIWYVLNKTAWGRHVYAVGDDPEAASLSGINTDRVLRSVYTVAGIICAFGAIVLIGRVGGTVTPLAGETANLDSITAVVIGGTSLFGGRGSIVGTVIGALIVGVFRNGLSLSGVDVLWQDFTVGILIIVAVALDQWIRKVAR
ncbi:MAG: ABC transporter permease [Phyllobacteriaceae bacterium]|nr:ABC transporter permease [Phyllobacteriaceae bacterium]